LKLRLPLVHDVPDALCGVTAAALVFLVERANTIVHVRAQRFLGYGVNGVYQRAVSWVSRTLKPARECEKLAVADVAVHE
jgi:hypothetical protein